MVKQISVFLENKEGNLAEFSRLLSENDINLRALSMAEAGEFGIVRMIVDDVYKATTSLKEADYVASVKDVLAVEIPDEAGSLAKVLAVLGSESVNVEYMYAFTNHTPGKAYMIFRVTDNQYASAVLAEHGVHLMTQEDIRQL